MSRGICYGVSVGPGAPGLITIDALKCIEAADIIFLPSQPKEDCRAYQIIKKTMPDIDKKEIRYETFTMSRDKTVMTDRHQEIFENIQPLLDEGKNIAFLTLGEVALYSTYLYIHEKLLKAGYDTVLVSGVSSVQAVCARLGIPLAIGEEEVHIFPDITKLTERLALDGTKIFMKPKGGFEKVISEIQKFINLHPETRVYGISNCGMENEIIAKGVMELKKLQSYFTVIVVRG